MDYKQLQSFIEVVRCRSFSAAAEKLGTSQPTISTHIKNLEEELNSRLIIRTARNFEVTPRGQEVFECSQNILKIWDGMTCRFNGGGQKVIHIGASTIPSAYILPEVLPSFGKVYEDIYFVVDQNDSQGIIEAVRKGTYDIGLVGMRMEDETLVFRRFYQDKMVIVAPVNDHFLSMKQKGNISVETLLKEPVILRENGSGSRKSAACMLEKMGISEESLHVVARINDQESVKNLVAGGLGISIVSEKAVKDYLAAKRLLAFELPGGLSGRQLYIIYKKDYIMKPYVRLFTEYLIKYYM